MATEKWIAGSGQGLTWGNAFTGTTLNSIANGNSILSDLQIDNSVAFDVFADISINLASLAVVAPNFIGIYLYPLNADGTTYGDGQYGTSAGGTPPPLYYAGIIPLVAATQAQEGTLRGVILPPGKFKFVLNNQAGVALAASANTCQYRTYNRQIS